MAIVSQGHSQCVQAVDFNNWSAEGHPLSWNITSGGAGLNQTVNANYPGFFVGPDTLINVKITGTFEVADCCSQVGVPDDDYVGFVFGYKDPAGAPTTDCEFILFDWKQNGQLYSGYTAMEGFSLNRVNGNFPYTLAGTFPYFWEHTNNGTLWQTLATDFSTTNGWVNYQSYDFTLIYTASRAIVMIDNDTIFDYQDCFEPGLFGFYNYSQAETFYSNFDYSLYVDFQFQSENICLGDTARITLIDTGCSAYANAFSNIDTFYWDMGDGTILADTNPVHLYSSVDTFMVSLIATDNNGCTDTTTKEILVQADPVPAINFANTCRDDTVFFTDLTTVPVGFVSAHDWTFSNGTFATGPNPGVVFNTDGTYNVHLDVMTNAGCTGFLDTAIVIHPLPQPQFAAAPQCVGDTVYFADQSSPAAPGVPIVQWQWDFDNDGSFDATGPNASHIYATHGVQPVELTVTDTRGCDQSLAQTVNVIALPEPDFQVANECLHDTSSFIDLSTVPSGNVVGWEWDFGDQQTSTTQNPAHLYGQPGLYQVKLIAENSLGCKDSIAKNMRVYPLPVAAFVSDSVCESDNAFLADQSTSAFGSINQWRWAFGDGTSVVNTKNASHIYAGPGKYTATHIAITEFGCSDTVEGDVRIYPVPKAAFTWGSSVCLGDTMQFLDQSTVAQTTPGGDEVVDWLWYFEGMDTIAEQNPSYAPQTGGFAVTLRVESNYGCSDVATGHPVVFPLPEAKFAAGLGCEDSPVRFTDQTTVAVGQVDRWLWKFGDGDMMDLQNPQKVYTAPGAYAVTLTTWSNQDCMDSVETSIIINEMPVAGFEVIADSGCSPLEVEVQNNSEIGKGDLSYRWHLDGKWVSEEKSPTFILENDSLHGVPHGLRLTALSDFGCWHQSGVAEVMVYPAPVAGFTSVPGSVDMFEPRVEFRNNSQYAYAWQWDFGDGTASTDFSPVHEFRHSGDFKVVLTAVNEYQCTDTAMKLFNVEPITTIYIPAGFTPNGDGINDVFYVRGFNEGKDFNLRIWDRWGNLAYDRNGMDNGWDGILPDGAKAPSGTYAYEIRYRTSEGRKEKRQGQVTVVR